MPTHPSTHTHTHNFRKNTNYYYRNHSNDFMNFKFILDKTYRTCMYIHTNRQNPFVKLTVMGFFVFYFIVFFLFITLKMCESSTN